MPQFPALGELQRAKTLQGFTTAGQMATKSPVRLHTGRKSKVEDVLEIVK
jgi:hypothetical protein